MAKILVTEITGGKDEPPFARLQLPKYLLRTIAAFDVSGNVIGQTRIEPLPPVVFAELPESFSIVRSGGSKGTRIGKEKGCIVLSVSGSMPIPTGAARPCDGAAHQRPDADQPAAVRIGHARGGSGGT